MPSATASIAGRSVVADIAGERVAREEYALLRHPRLAGIILFSRNYRDPGQLTTLCNEIRDIAGRHVIIAVDQEGGRVQRFREGFTILPPMAAFGRLHDHDPDAALSLAREAAMVMALELRLHGVDLSFAPVADLDYGICEVIGNRAFHRNPLVVSGLCNAWHEGMRDAGMCSVAKHFPGHGAVGGDSHLETPLDDRELVLLEKADLLPFESLIENGLEAVMTAHVHYPCIAPDVPTFSSIWIQHILRGRLGFEGVVFSDDLTMAGAASAGTPVQRADAALAAGCDVILVCNDRDAAREVLDGCGDPVGARGIASLAGSRIDDTREQLAARAARVGPLLADLVRRQSVGLGRS